MAFQIPLHFEDITRNTAGTWQVTPYNQREASSEHLLNLFSDNVEVVFSSSTSASQQFCALYTVISRYQNLSDAQRHTLVDIVVSLLQAAKSTDVGQLKIALFHASGLSVTASNASPACKFWEKPGRETLLEAVHNTISAISLPSSFPQADLDQLSSLLIRTTLQVLEHPGSAKDKHIRPLIARCLATALLLDKRQLLPAITALVHALCRHEHLPIPLSEVLYCLYSEHSQFEPFVSDLIREITRLPDERLVQDTAAAKSVSTFLSDFVERHASVFSENITLVLSLLDVDSYVLRNGVVHVIATLIQHKPKADDPLLDVLLQRALRDTHAFTRSKALQSWIVLVKSSAVPIRMFLILAEIATSRLEDRTAAVRKYAVQLLSTLLESNPFGPILKLSHFSRKLEEIRQQIPDAERQTTSEATEVSLETEKEKNSNQEDTSCSSDEDGTPDKNAVTSLNSDALEEVQDEDMNITGEDDNETETTTLSEEEEQAVKKSKYYTLAMDFITMVEKGLETIFEMLRSKSVTDVAEAVAYLVTAVQFQLEAASGGTIRKMLPLLLARENNISEKAIEAYVRLLVPGGVETLVGKEAAISVAKGLAALVEGATIGELTCLEELVSALSSNRKEYYVMTPTVVGVLWDMFADRIPGATYKQRHAAGIVVAMVAVKQPDSLVQRIDVILEFGLCDPTFIRWACVALSNLSPEKDPDGKLVKRLLEICKSSNDLASVEQALNGIYALSREPELIAGGLIRDLAAKLHACPEKVAVQDLARFLQVIGEVAIKQLVRVELMVSKLNKKCFDNSCSENNDEEEKARLEIDFAQEDAEKELVSPNSLLGRYSVISQKVASDESAPSKLRASAVLCLAKLMCVQSKFCKNNLRLLFSILASSKDPIVRTNAVTALGDLTFRFPNLVEPWSSHIYKSLRDEDKNVRKSTLLVLTHLILNDMIKVRGEIVGIAICITDKEYRIADLARLFFVELSHKSVNAICNILPDTISCMSKMDYITSECFKIVVGFLVGLMDKERHADSMVEKLCHRFRSSESTQENRNLAFCISQLNISTKGLQKLNENFRSYSGAILDELVHEYFLQAFAKGNKSTAPGTVNQTWEELNAKVKAVYSPNASDNDDTPSSVPAKSTRSSNSETTTNNTEGHISTRQRSTSSVQGKRAQKQGTVKSKAGQRKSTTTRSSVKKPSTQVCKSVRPQRTSRSTRIMRESDLTSEDEISFDEEESEDNKNEEDGSNDNNSEEENKDDDDNEEDDGNDDDNEEEDSEEDDGKSDYNEEDDD